MVKTISNPNPNLHIDMLKTQLDIIHLIAYRKIKNNEDLTEINKEDNILHKLIKEKENDNRN